MKPLEVTRIESSIGAGIDSLMANTRNNPLDRPAEKVLEGVLDDFCTMEHARAAYGVVVDLETETVDWPASHGGVAIATARKANCRSSTGCPVLEQWKGATT